MNAYELANQLAFLLMLNGLNEQNTDEINQASHMLRQQADRIAELEKSYAELEDKYVLLSHTTPQTNAEPVAWVNLEAWLSGKEWGNDCFGSEYFTGSIPLYATPQTELKPTLVKVDGKLMAVTMTDEEHRIHEVLWEAPQTKPLSDEEIEKCFVFAGKDFEYPYAFARAIEERILGK